jgi:hypothetical protein
MLQENQDGKYESLKKTFLANISANEAKPLSAIRNVSFFTKGIKMLRIL